MSHPRVFISYCHTDEIYEQKMFEFANRLRKNGIDANIDLFEECPVEGWPRWMENQIRESDFVIVVCSEAYAKRFYNDHGKGVTWEIQIIYQTLYDNTCETKKFIPVFWNSVDEKYILMPLKPYTYYNLDTEKGYHSLLKRLIGIKKYEKDKLGNIDIRNYNDSEKLFEKPHLTKFVAMSSKYNSRINPKRILILCYTFLFIVMGGVCYQIYINHKFDNIFEDAERYFETNNFLEASKLFNQAASCAPSIEKYVKASSYEGDCYMMLAMLAQLYDKDELNPFISNYDKAIQIYYRIISNDEDYKGTEYYYDAAAGLSNCYLYCDYPVTDYRWKKAIEIMEEYSDNLNSESNMSQVIKIYNALWQYYNHLSNESLERKLDPDVTTKLRKYLSAFTVLLSEQHYADGIIDKSDIDLIVQGLENEIAFSISVDEPQKYIPYVITGCKDIISNIESNQIIVDDNCYFSVQYVLGKANVYMGMIDKTGKHIEYYNEAYHILSELLTSGLNDNTNDLSDVAYYCILTGMCTSEDLHSIEDLMDEITMEIITPDLDEKNFHLALEILTIYSGIIELYEYSDEKSIFQKAVGLVEKLSKTIYNTKSKDSEIFTIYDEYFHDEISKDELPIVKIYEHFNAK